MRLARMYLDTPLVLRPVSEAEPNSPGSDQRPAATVHLGEWQIVGWAAAWFFFVLLSYFMVRPVREMMGAIAGTARLQWLMLATFSAMLVAVPAYSTLVNRLSRRWLVRVVFHFFSGSLLAFSLTLSFGSEALQTWAARAFFVWVNVFSLFATSVFWSVLADLLTSEQGKRLFGKIAAGGTVGAIAGSLVTSQIATSVSTANLLLLPIATLQLGLWCAWRLERAVRQTVAEPSESEWREAESSDDATASPQDRPATGGLWDGITHVLSSPYLALICVFLFFVQASGTQLYLQQAEIVAASVDGQGRTTQVFAYLDFATQLLTLLAQFFLSGFLLRRLGVSIALAVLPSV